MSICMGLRTKLLTAFFAIGMIPFCLFAVVALYKAEQGLSSQAFAQLESMRDVKKNQVEYYLKTIKDQIVTFSEDHMVVAAMEEFSQAYEDFVTENQVNSAGIADLRNKLTTYYTNEFSSSYREQNEGRDPHAEQLLEKLDDSAIALQYHYIIANPNPPGAKHKLDRSLDSSRYSQVHERFHPTIRNYLERFGYYDIFLVQPKTGKVVYSVFKELDFATSLTEGPYTNSNFAEAFRLADGATSVDAFVIIDFKQYLPSYDAPAAFVASPIFKGDKKLGILIFQFPLDSLNSIMKQRAGMGKSGETYLVGSDLLMRSDSFLDAQNHTVVASFRHPDKGRVDTAASREALQGKTGQKIIIDYNGNPVLSAFAPLQFKGLRWALLAEIDEAEAFAAIKSLEWTAGIVAIFALAAVLALALFIARAIVRPVQGVVANLTDLAQGEGDLTSRLPVAGGDEIGVLALRFNEFMEKLHAMIKNIAKGIETLSSSSTELSAISQQLSAGAGQTSGKSSMVATSAEEMSTNMNSISAAMEESSTNIGMVASAAEEMTATIGEIAQNTEKARTVAADAVVQTRRAGEQMAELGNAAQTIGKVTETITEISEQTNLLALNATIEAARAGEAGKGFAVVANEIKELAKQTAVATQDIKRQIEGVQHATGTTVQSIDQIGRVIEGVSHIVTTIATAVEEQTAATKEIADNIAQASCGIGEVNENVSQSSHVTRIITKDIEEVNKASGEIAESSAQVRTSADELSVLAEQLNEMVRRFKV